MWSLALAGCGPGEARVTAFRASVIERANAVEQRAYTRPPADPARRLPGSFGEAFDAAATERGVVEASVETSNRCATLLGDKRAPLDGPKQDCLKDLETTSAALTKLLSLRHAERPGPPPSARPFAKAAPGEKVHRSLLSLCARARAEVRALVARDDAQAAASTCTSTLAVARDYALGSAMTGALAASQCIKDLEEPCADAIRALPAESEARPRGRQELEAIAATLPRFPDVFETELVGILLPLCAPLFDASDRDKLEPRARAVVVAADTAEARSSSRRTMSKLCVEGWDELDLAARAFRAPVGSPERARLRAEREAYVTTMPKTSFDKFEDGLAAAEATVRSLSTL
ncbi:MAG: hypothetical protein KF764_02700 [Labilithrix sp.]|nr:hypothetical protein [Labilithrix sp.]